MIILSYDHTSLGQYLTVCLKPIKYSTHQKLSYNFRMIGQVVLVINIVQYFCMAQRSSPHLTAFERNISPFFGEDSVLLIFRFCFQSQDDIALKVSRQSTDHLLVILSYHIVCCISPQLASLGLSLPSHLQETLPHFRPVTKL